MLKVLTLCLSLNVFNCALGTLNAQTGCVGPPCGPNYVPCARVIGAWNQVGYAAQVNFTLTYDPADPNPEGFGAHAIRGTSSKDVGNACVLTWILNGSVVRTPGTSGLSAATTSISLVADPEPPSEVCEIEGQIGIVDFISGQIENDNCSFGQMTSISEVGEFSFQLERIPEIPNPSESTSFVGWGEAAAEATRAEFVSIIGDLKNFSGRQVFEATNHLFDSDSCFRAGDALIGFPAMSISGGGWCVGADAYNNDYGVDSIGLTVNYIYLYQANNRVPCTVNVGQDMRIYIPDGSQVYRTLGSGTRPHVEVSYEKVLVSRNGAEENRPWGVQTGSALFPLLPGIVGVPYSAQLQAVFLPPEGYNWATQPVAGALPPGLQISSSGSITGTPTEAGVFSFRVYVESTPVGYEAERPLNLTILPPPPGSGALPGQTVAE